MCRPRQTHCRAEKSQTHHRSNNDPKGLEDSCGPDRILSLHKTNPDFTCPEVGETTGKVPFHSLQGLWPKMESDYNVMH